jgi:hypothetical protein
MSRIDTFSRLLMFDLKKIDMNDEQLPAGDNYIFFDQKRHEQDDIS